MRRPALSLALLACAVGSFAAAFLISRGSSRPAAASVVDEIRTELATSYYRPVPARILRMHSIPSMLAALDDPYTRYLDPTAYRLLLQETSASYSGVGITVVPVAGGLHVVAVQRGPAREAGIRVGDRLTTIGGVAIASLTFEDALGKLLGPPRSTLRIGVVRGARALAFRVQRRVLRAPTCESRVLAAGGRRIGYLRLTAFGAGATQNLRGALRRTEAQGVSGLVLDLRGNPGGLVDRGIAVASLFLHRGVIVTIVGGHRAKEVYRARGGLDATALPLVVLVDGTTASAAEIVAAALKDHRRALIVGEPTFGKALVQSVQPLPNGAALKLTIARYLTPNGTDISGAGVHPDVLSADDPRTPSDEPLELALRTLTAK
jgi:carboxyl-terminal processing protease